MRHERFVAAYQRWVSLPFPDGSDDDGLDELHAQLAYADAMVAEAAQPLSQKSSRRNRVPDQVVSDLRNVTARADEYGSSANEAYVRLALSYRIYANALLDVLEALG